MGERGKKSIANPLAETRAKRKRRGGRKGPDRRTSSKKGEGGGREKRKLNHQPLWPKARGGPGGKGKKPFLD